MPLSSKLVKKARPASSLPAQQLQEELIDVERVGAPYRSDGNLSLVAPGRSRSRSNRRQGPDHRPGSSMAWISSGRAHVGVTLPFKPKLKSGFPVEVYGSAQSSARVFLLLMLPPRITLPSLWTARAKAVASALKNVETRPEEPKLVSSAVRQELGCLEISATLSVDEMPPTTMRLSGLGPSSAIESGATDTQATSAERRVEAAVGVVADECKSSAARHDDFPSDCNARADPYQKSQRWW